MTNSDFEFSNYCMYISILIGTILLLLLILSIIFGTI